MNPSPLPFCSLHFVFPAPFYVSDYVKSQAHNNASLTGLEQVVSGYS